MHAHFSFSPYNDEKLLAILISFRANARAGGECSQMHCADHRLDVLHRPPFKQRRFFANVTGVKTRHQRCLGAFPQDVKLFRDASFVV